MTDNKQIFYDVAGRCPMRSRYGPERLKRIALLYLDHQHTEKEIFSLADVGLNRIVGLVAVNREGNLESVSLSQPEFIRAVNHAATVFAEATEKAQREVAQLERLMQLGTAQA